MKTLCTLGGDDRFGRSHCAAKVVSSDRILRSLTERQAGTSTCFRVTKLSFNNSGAVTGAKFGCYLSDGYTNFAQSWRDIKIFKAVLVGLRVQGKIREFGLHHFVGETTEQGEEDKIKDQGFIQIY